MKNKLFILVHMFWSVLLLRFKSLKIIQLIRQKNNKIMLKFILIKLKNHLFFQLIFIFLIDRILQINHSSELKEKCYFKIYRFVTRPDNILWALNQTQVTGFCQLVCWPKKWAKFGENNYKIKTPSKETQITRFSRLSRIFLLIWVLIWSLLKI